MEEIVSVRLVFDSPVPPCVPQALWGRTSCWISLLCLELALRLLQIYYTVLIPSSISFVVEVIPLTALAVDAVPQPLLSVWRGPASPPTGLPTILSGQTHGPYSIRPGHMQPCDLCMVDFIRSV